MTGHPESGMTRGRLLIVLLIVGALILGGLWFMQNRGSVSDSRSAGDTFVAALLAKDSKASYGLLSKDFKKATTEEDWRVWVDFTFEGEDGTYKFVKETPIQQPEKTYPKDSDPARFTYEYTLNGETFHFDIVALKEGGVWKISEIGSIEQ